MKKVVSLDIFDTAIFRITKEPKEVFKIVEEQIKEFCSFSFYTERIKAEKQARSTSNYEEITLGEIYDQIDMNIELKEKIKKIEIETELSICVVNPYIFKQYNKFVAEGYDIVFTSDMYLDIDTIKRILDKCGYKKYRKIYLSSEIRKTKITGSLYLQIINDLGVPANRVLHIGNSLKSDYLRPKKYGIHSRYFNGNDFRPKFTSITDISVEKLNYINRYEDTISNKVGYEIMGPFILGFASWIYQSYREYKKEKVFYLARDGFLLSEIHRQYIGDDCEYLRVSRKSLRNAVLSFGMEYSEFCKLIPPFKIYTIEMFLDLFSIDKDDLYNKFVEEANSNAFTTISYNDIGMCTCFETIYNQAINEMKPFYEQQRKCLKRYLEQKEFLGNIAIVDLSFKGTAFHMLRLFCEHEGILVDMDGFVIGKSKLMAERIEKDAKRIHGWVFEIEEENPEAHLLISNATMYERFLFDNSGSTISYYESDNGEIVPLLSMDNEINNVEIILSVREGIKKFANDYYNIYKYIDTPISVECSLSRLIKFILNPKCRYSYNVGDMVEDNIITVNIAKPEKIIKYIASPTRLKRDMKSSFWKQCFILRLTKSHMLIHCYNHVYFKQKGIPFQGVLIMYKRFIL